MNIGPINTKILSAITQKILIVDDEPYNQLALNTILIQAEKLLNPKTPKPLKLEIKILIKINNKFFMI